MAKDAQIPLRVKQKVKYRLVELAKEDKRSLNTYCEILFETHIALKKQKERRQK